MFAVPEGDGRVLSNLSRRGVGVTACRVQVGPEPLAGHFNQASRLLTANQTARDQASDEQGQQQGENDDIRSGALILIEGS